MANEGVRRSRVWTQIFKISYQNIQIQNIDDGLACLYVNSDMVIFANESLNQPFVYNLKDKRVRRIEVRKHIQWFDQAMDSVESLVSVP